jgi:hypothetical protein
MRIDLHAADRVDRGRAGIAMSVGVPMSVITGMAMGAVVGVTVARPAALAGIWLHSLAPKLGPEAGASSNGKVKPRLGLGREARCGFSSRRRIPG